MPVYSLASLVSWPTADPWDVFFQHATNPAIGYRVVMTKATNVYAISDVYEGTARPAWYPSWTADRTNTVTTSTGGSVPHNYYSLDNAADWIEWDVTADGAGCDTLIVAVVGVLGAGTLDVVKNPGGGEATVGTVDTSNGSTSYALERTVNLAAPLVAGDIIRLRRTSGETNTCRVRCMRGYDSDGTVSTHGRTFALPSSTKIDATGASSVECAYAVAPDGESPNWIGGIAHQTGAGTCTEVSPVVVFTHNGTTGALTPGWVTGTVQMSRTSDVDYNDAGHTILGTLSTVYSFDDRGYGVETEFTAAIDLSLGTLYVTMCEPSTQFTWAFIRAGKYWEGYATTATDDSETEASATVLPAVKGVLYGPSPLKALWKTTVLNKSHAATRSHFWHRAAGSKWYVKIDPGAAAAGATWGGAWRSEFVNIVNRTQQPRIMLLP